MFKRTNVNLHIEQTKEVQNILKGRGVSFSWLVRHLLANWLKEKKTKDIKEL